MDLAYIDFSYVFMLFEFELSHKLTIIMDSSISFDEGFGEVHNVLIGGLLKPIHTDSTEVSILYVLHVL